jgi:predicted component of type VI protein secretion system
MRDDPPEWSPLVELLGEVMRAAGQARRIKGDLNRAVAALQSLGHPNLGLEEHAKAAAVSIRKMDDVAEQIRKALERV